MSIYTYAFIYIYIYAITRFVMSHSNSKNSREYESARLEPDGNEIH